jgi:hypothetical protein
LTRTSPRAQIRFSPETDRELGAIAADRRTSKTAVFESIWHRVRHILESKPISDDMCPKCGADIADHIKGVAAMMAVDPRRERKNTLDAIHFLLSRLIANKESELALLGAIEILSSKDDTMKPFLITAIRAATAGKQSERKSP